MTNNILFVLLFLFMLSQPYIIIVRRKDAIDDIVIIFCSCLCSRFRVEGMLGRLKS